MRRILAIAGLTWKAAFRYRLFWVMAGLLAVSVVGLPLVLQGDGTAQGLTQILITYTLAASATLLGFFTLWFSCGTLARDIEDCQMQIVCVKPISRWQVWIGKWVGIIGLNAVLLALAGTMDYTLLQYRASQLPADQQKLLREKVFIARAGVKDRPPDLTAMVEKDIKEWHKRNAGQMLTDQEATELRKQSIAKERARFEDVQTNSVKEIPWVIDLSRLPESVRRKPLEVRIKFHSSLVTPAESYTMLWQLGDPVLQQARIAEMRLPADSFQEFEIPAEMIAPSGRMMLSVFNPNDCTLTFPLEDGFELLYYENTFAVNFARGLLVVLCWMGLLAMIGMAAASHLSFPVAAFTALAILVMGVFSGTISTVVENNTIFGYNPTKGGFEHTPLDNVVVPVFKGVLTIINLVQSFSPIDALSTGRSVSWAELGRAAAQIILVLGGAFAVVGIILFSRRELASVQTN